MKNPPSRPDRLLPGAELLRQKRIAFSGEDKELDVQPIHIPAADKK